MRFMVPPPGFLLAALMALFAASAMAAPPGSYTWTFADGSPAVQGQIVSHTFSPPGEYTVNLGASDNCGGYDMDTVRVVVQSDSQPKIGLYELMSKKLLGLDSDGSKVWSEYLREIPEGEQIELGLKVKFNASSFPPATYYFMGFGDNSWNPDIYSPISYHAYSEPGQYLTWVQTYDEAGNQISYAELPVTVAQGMTKVPQSFQTRFTPRAVGVHGSELWAIGQGGLVGVADVSDPNAPGGVTIIMNDYPAGSHSIALFSSYLFVPLNISGLDVRDVSSHAFELKAHIPPESLAGGRADYVAVVKQNLFVVSGNGPIDCFDITNPTMPVHVKRIGEDLANIWSMVPAGLDSVVLRCGAQDLRIIDAREHNNPVLLPDPVVLPDSGIGGLWAADGTVAAELDDYDVQLIELVRFGGELKAYLAARIDQTLKATSASMVGGRLYLSLAAAMRVAKFDCTDPANPYLMGTTIYLNGNMLPTSTPFVSQGVPFLAVGVDRAGFHYFLR